ncbi:hypothetical protein, partial [Escherichia coli]|uniref:hypothetical protein n=1 Tax=Escherichia coli TaxID=562 RepID=UPI0015E62BD0
FTFPNLDDKDYALYSLNEESLANVELVLAGAIADPLLRMLTWNMLSQMVRDGQLAPLRYHALAVGGLRKEDDEGVL